MEVEKVAPGPVTYTYNCPKELEDMKPVKESLTIDQSKISADMIDAMKPLLEISKKHMWHWKIFPIVLPQPNMMQNETTSGSGPKKKTINIKDLFIAPKFNELEAIATNSQGNPKKLTHEQIQNIHRTGEFSVDSVQFPGQKHTWRLSNILQKGSERSTETMYRNFSSATQLFVVLARELMVGDDFSMRQSINGWSEGFMNILEILIGLPHLETSDIEDKLQEERIKFLVCELNSKDRETTEKIVAFLQQARDSKSLSKLANILPKLPYVFYNLRNNDIDLRLHNEELRSRLKPTLTRIMKTESEGWFPEFRENLIYELKEKNVGNNEIEKQVNKIVMEEYLKRVCKAIQAEKIIQEAGEGITELLVNQLKAGIICQEALETVKEDIKKQLNDEEEQLKIKNPICSQIKAWMERKLKEKESKLTLENQWTAHNKALDACQSAGLEQHAYFLSRDLAFLKNQEPVLRRELKENMKMPVKTFEFETRIWNPNNWKITLKSNNESKRVATVIHSEPDEFEHFDNVEGTSFIINKDVVRTNSTGNAFWRWTNLFHGVWSCIWNFIFWFGIVVPFCSGLSFRSLFCLEEFYPDYKLSQKNGALYKDPESRTETLASRLKILWKHVADKRKEFEAMPDRGLLGKSVSRHINRFNNYFLKGFFGSLMIILFFPICCLAVSSLSIMFALIGPFLIPPFALFGLLMSVLFMDYLYPSVALFPSLIWNILFTGIFTPLASFVVAFVFCPVAAFFIVVFAVLRKSFRQIWDSFLFHLVLKKRARVPAFNNFIAKRIEGPGMASNFFYQVKTEQVLVALEAQMELEELEAFRVQLGDIISSPLEDYHKFIANTMRPFSLTVTKGLGGPYQRLATETSDLLASLGKKVDFRMSQLRLELSPNMKERIKLSERELKLALGRGASMTCGFYPQHIIARTKGGEIEFWEKRRLRLNDWVGLTSKLYSTIFTPEFLTPMQEEDTTFKLKIDHWNLSRYLNMVIESDWHDDLDITQAVRSPKGNLEIPAPSLDPSLFNPSAEINQYRSTFKSNKRFRWALVRRKRPNPQPRLCVPLPVPHPAELILIIHNQDSKVHIELENSQKIISYLSNDLTLHKSRESPTKSELFRNPDRYESDDETEPLKKTCQDKVMI
eukprot:GFUD01040338.1.p1 GENE.GFUD01040338.1~~GFUD01040338.1.p1  ORF type:complete len:1135 (+),score=193.14 GFUD01040338.1:117-3521(+)